MPQSSLTAWLKKPAAVVQAPASTALTAERGVPDEARTQLPTPPSSSAPTENGVSAQQGSKPVEQHATVTHVLSRTTWPQLPPNVHIRACTKADVAAFKRLNSLLLPIPYPESFYGEILSDTLTNNITLLATWHDDPCTFGQDKGRLIGAIRCRLFAHPLVSPSDSASAGEKPMLYLSTLVLLAPYRSYGIAAQMLHLLTVRAVEQYGIGSSGAHVWEANQEGLEWYAKRGFKIVGREAEYYRRLKPSGAVVVRREIRVTDLMSG
ncbi:hypothetical protein LTR53_009459 [Teratosphaeriaceae sp. CCFEE 6253]|nr:hypothetical protein LTR53_009459 [Teratosphaeriaceae sp. CCFEE 6253]